MRKKRFRYSWFDYVHELSSEGFVAPATAQRMGMHVPGHITQRSVASGSVVPLFCLFHLRLPSRKHLLCHVLSDVKQLDSGLCSS